MTILSTESAPDVSDVDVDAGGGLLLMNPQEHRLRQRLDDYAFALASVLGLDAKTSFVDSIRHLKITLGKA